MMSHVTHDSNAELLRIVSIFCIVLHHFCVHALYPEVLACSLQGTSWDNHLLLSLQAFLYIGVNCFILISGWYGIHTRWRNFLRLYGIYAFYCFLQPFGMAIMSYWRGEGLTFPYSIGETVMHTLLPFSHGHEWLWFVDCYLALFLVAPLLNYVASALNFSNHLFLLLGFSLLSVFLCAFRVELYFCHIYLINDKGYSLMNFIYLYMIARFLHRHVPARTIDIYRWHWFSGYVLSGGLWGLWAVSQNTRFFQWTTCCWHVFAYNNPFILMTAVFFFLFVLSWHFSSTWINLTATSTLGVYMLQEMIVGYDWLKPYARVSTPALRLGIWMGTSLSFFVVAVGIDQLRRLLVGYALRLVRQVNK